ncbi:MAG: sugar ABC transporter permease [Armatimonadetes bacterium]|nr:sugar ABC transporter permease [Armatimonadota bacterium]
MRRALGPLQMLIHVVLLASVVILLMPVFWVVLASLREFGSLYGGGESGPVSLKNYGKLLTTSQFMLWVRNSLFVCGLSAFLSLCFTTTAGYAFARFRFAGRNHGLMTLIILQMFPAMMAMWALYLLLDFLDLWTAGWVGFNLLGLVLVYTGANVPFNTWMIKGYLDNVPKELEESACIDGATPWQTFRLVVLPLMGPILVVVSLLTFIGAYNDFLIPSIILQDDSQYTLAVGLRSFISGRYDTNWTEFAAASVMGALPILVLFLSLQRFLVEGLTKGAVKG